jgi:hypothetical protein
LDLPAPDEHEGILRPHLAVTNEFQPPALSLPSSLNMTGNLARLRLLLRLLGAICVLAIVPLVVPIRWLDATHQWMGLGPFPSAPIAVYLARSVSSLCVFYGGLLLVLAHDVKRYAIIISYQAVAIMLLSAYGIVAGIRAGFPAFWVIADAIGCWIFLLPILVLSRTIARP